MRLAECLLSNYSNAYFLLVRSRSFFLVLPNYWFCWPLRLFRPSRYCFLLVFCLSILYGPIDKPGDFMLIFHLFSSSTFPDHSHSAGFLFVIFRIVLISRIVLIKIVRTSDVFLNLLCSFLSCNFDWLFILQGSPPLSNLKMELLKFPYIVLLQILKFMETLDL